jgi:hypothetical protein
MFGRTLSLAIGLCGALAASQLPEFTQQYSQRLGGRIDELTLIVSRFDRDSIAVSEDRQSAIARLARSPDELVRRQSSAMADNIVRLKRLQAQLAAMATAGSFGRISAFLSDPDPGVAASTWDNFQPAIPATGEGVASGGAGFLVGGGLMAFIARLFRRRPGYAEAQ